MHNVLVTGQSALSDVCKRFCSEPRHDDACLALQRLYNTLADIGNEAGRAFTEDRPLDASRVFGSVGFAMRGFTSLCSDPDRCDNPAGFCSVHPIPEAPRGA